MGDIHDLRSYLSVLRQKNELMVIDKRVALVHELAGILKAVEGRSGPAVVFSDVGLPPWRVLGGLLATNKRIAIALDCRPEEVSALLDEALMNPLSAAQVEKPKWAEHVVREEVDITRLPIPTHSLGDAGPFLTGGVVFAKDPVGGRGNLSFHRAQVKGPTTLGLMVNEWRHFNRFLRAAEEIGQPLEVAICVGLDPAILIAAGLRTPHDEIEIAGAIRRTPIPLSSCYTVDLHVPAEAELVIEGRIPVGRREAEGPLAEFTGHYGTAWDSPVVEVTAICHRKDPIYHTIVPGCFEHLNLGNVLAREGLLHRFVEHVSGDVRAVHIPPYGAGFLTVVALEKENPGQPRNVGLAALAAHVNFKVCLVVDPDVDIHSASDILWALSTRVDWAEDVLILPGCQGHELDPTSDIRGVQSKIIIDATLDKGRRDYEARAEFLEVDLDQFLDIQSGWNGEIGDEDG